MKSTWKTLIAAVALVTVVGCSSVGGSTATGEPTNGETTTPSGRTLDLEVEPGSLDGKTVCFNFQALETEFWAAGVQAISAALSEAGAEVLEFNSNEDANRQLEQINDCITQEADGIIFIPQDGASADTVIARANEASVPVVAFNRPPASDTGQAIVVVADNRDIARQTVEYMVGLARDLSEAEDGRKIQPLVMVGDLGDVNAVDRRDGYYDAIEAEPDLFEDTIEVETQWDATVAQQNLQSALQANPDVDLIFSGSDFMYPQIQSVLSPMGRWKTVDEEGHVILGALDGDNRACNLMRDGYVDATGVQDLFFEAEASIKELTAAIQDGETHPDRIAEDKGFALTQANMPERETDMWGCVIDPPQ